MSGGQLYFNGEILSAVEEIKIEETEMPFPVPNRTTVEFTIKIDHKKWRKMLGYISQKRFRKLLYSIGYQRNQVNEIIEIMWNLNKSYRIRDVEYWKEYLVR